MTDEERPETHQRLPRWGIERNAVLKASIQQYGDEVERDDGSLLSSICFPINGAEILKEYDLEDKDWDNLMAEIVSDQEDHQEKMKRHVKKRYGKRRRNALMSILVCHPPLQIVKCIVELGGNDTVTEVSGCGFNAVHYACWGNASLEVIRYLLGIGGKTVLLHQSAHGGANPLHIACTRYSSTESNSLCDLIRHLIEVGDNDVVTSTDFNGEIPLQGLLLRPAMPVESVITYLDEWYKIGEIQEATPDDSYTNNIFTDEDNKDDTRLKRNHTINEAFNKLTQQLLKTDYDARSQILKTDFMKKHLTERFIQPIPLAVLVMDLYVQVLIVCVFSFFINNTFPNPVKSTTINLILVICVSWRLLREMMQLVTSSLGAYVSDLFNICDIVQLVFIIWTMGMDLDDHSSGSNRTVLTIATFYSWVELLLELHNFRYDLAVFVTATIKVMNRLSNFIFSTLIFVCSFASMYYISVTNDANFCSNPGNLTDTEFNSIGGFTCSRRESYLYSLTNLFTFETPSGVPQLIPLFYAFVMLILFLNVIIAVICTAFEEVLAESEMSFWCDRLTIVNELGGFLACIPGILTKCPGLHSCKLFCHHIHILGLEGRKRNVRIDLNLFLPKLHWDSIKDEDKQFIHWWYGKSGKEEVPKRWDRLSFFFKKSRTKDIFIPGNVFENVFLGNSRSHRPTQCEKLYVLPFSLILLVASNLIFAVIFISGWISFGLLWPKEMRRRIFSVNTEKKRIVPEIKKKNEEISEIKRVISEMRKENSEMRKENSDIKNENILMKNSIEEMMEKMISEIKLSVIKK